MIIFKNVSKTFSDKEKKINVFNDISLTINHTDRVAVMGPKLAGKSTFIRMLTGFEKPDRGEIRRHCDLSYTVGSLSVLSLNMTGRENVRHLAMVFSADPEKTTEFVARHSELGDALDQLVGDLDRDQKSRLSFMVSYALPFHVYVLDMYTGRGSDEFRNKCSALLDARARSSGIIFATGSPELAKRHCDKLILIDDGNAVLHHDINSGLEHFKELKSRLTAAQ